MELKKDARTISPEELKQRPHACRLKLDEVLHLFASPDTGMPLRLSEDRLTLTDDEHVYCIRDGLPILMPTRLAPFFTTRLQVPLEHYSDSFLQYFLLATIKQSGEVNAAPTEGAAQKHFFRMANFLNDCHGLALDVGCDDPSLGASLLPATAQYVGLDPFCSRTEPFRIIGTGEFLPFRKESFDHVLFNTSLDHIFDWRRALSQARDVLKKGGRVYISTYIWEERADLLTDSVHFHHFRYYELLGALDELGFDNVQADIYESPKGDTHRHGLYLKACKQ